MPQDRRFQYFFKSIVTYTEVEGALCLRNWRVKYFKKCIVGYIEVEMASCPRIRGFNAL